MADPKPTAVVGRAQWHALTPNTAHLDKLAPGDRRKIGATIHHTTGKALGTTDFSQWVRNIQQYHMTTLGYGDIAYGGLVDPAGRFYVGRDENTYVGAHAASHGNQANRQTRGIALLGDYSDTAPTPAAVHAIEWALGLMKYNGDDLLVFCHNDWSKYGPPALPTACPGHGGQRTVSLELRPYAASISH